MTSKPESAVCACGHRGRSSTPESYQCGYCYYSAVAKGTLKSIQRMREKIEELEAHAQHYLEQAQAFRNRHEDVCSLRDPYAEPVEGRSRSGKPLWNRRRGC